MRVIDEGRKPDPAWWGKWKCHHCKRIVELSGDDLPDGVEYYVGYSTYLTVTPCPTCGSSRTYLRYREPPPPAPPDPTFMDGVRKRRDAAAGWFRADDRRVKVALVLVAYVVGVLS